MKNIYESLTDTDGVLKSFFSEEELMQLLSNPFHITRNNVMVSCDQEYKPSPFQFM